MPILIRFKKISKQEREKNGRKILHPHQYLCVLCRNPEDLVQFFAVVTDGEILSVRRRDGDDRVAREAAALLTRRLVMLNVEFLVRNAAILEVFFYLDAPRADRDGGDLYQGAPSLGADQLVDRGLIETAHIFTAVREDDGARGLARELYEIIVGGGLLLNVAHRVGDTLLVEILLCLRAPRARVERKNLNHGNVLLYICLSTVMVLWKITDQ